MIFPNKKRFTSILLVAFLAFSFLSGEAHALKTPFVSVYGSIGLRTLYGTNESEDGTGIQSRKMAVYGGDAVLALKLSGVLLGVGADYNLWRQLTNSAQVSNSNTQGTQLNLSPVLGFRLGPITLLGKYFLSSEYKLEKRDTDGKSVSYSKPKSSYLAQLRVGVGPFSYLGGEYTSFVYDEETRGATTTAFVQGTKAKFGAFGLIYGLEF
jgi:hypothetical protein